ncbi:Zn-ribbon domain-containing OB-fold protein [Pseudorhodoferax sp.]|uniref:Zn-ribbon domain-containing OB-fold protein n=1 Tax=Pseudorhodoferax sp. TaxID=1993553 RepID=UPI002DD6AE9E|nr:Zn-ribbon domain-containing OB-fold protein [Pseudorhodoferax sp.]
MTTAPRPAPVPTEATQAFWDATAQGVLLVQRCSACRRTQSIPRPFCRHCGAESPSWERSAGLGSIYTFTVNHRAANAHMADQLPYVVAVVQLDEGARLMANIVGTPPEAVRIGDRVRVRFLPLSETLSLPQFEPMGSP